MNQRQTKALRRIFLSIQPFGAGDSRNVTAWRGFKRDYLKQPRPTRARYLSGLRSEVKRLLPEANEVAPATP